MAAHLRKSYSEDDLPTAPWRFPSFPCSSLFLSKVQISPKVTIACNGFCLLRHTKTGYCKKRPYGLVANGLVANCLVALGFFTSAVLQCMQNHGLCCTSHSRKAAYRLDIISAC